MAIRIGGIEFSIKVVADAAVSALRNFNRKLDETENKGKKTGKVITDIGNRLQNFGRGLADFGFKLALASTAAATAAALLAGRVQALGTVLQQVGTNAGYTSAQLNATEASVKSLGITTRASRLSLTQLIQAHVDLGDAAKLTRIAQDAAVIAGVDSSEAFNRLVVSVQRNDVRLLRNLGIVINLNELYAKFAQQTGRNINTLGALEKRQLLLNEVMIRGVDIAGTYEAAMGDVFKRFTSMVRLVEEATLAFGNNFIPVFEVVVDQTSALLKAFTEGENADSLQVFTASAVAMGVVVGGLAVVIGTVTAAVGGLVAAIGTLIVVAAPAAIALAAVAAAGAAALAALGLLAAVATPFVVAEFQTLKWAQALEEVRKEGEAAGQVIFDLSEGVRVLRNLERSGNRSADAMKTLKEEAEKAAAAMPELALELRRAAEAGDFEEVINLIGQGNQRAVMDTARVVDEAERIKRDAIVQTKAELVNGIITQEDANRIVRESIEEAGDLSLVLQKAGEHQAEFMRGSLVPTTDAMQEFTIGMTDTGEAIRNAQADFSMAAGALRALGDAADAKTFQQLTTAMEETAKASTQAEKALQELQNLRKRTLGETNQLLEEFANRQAQVTTAGLQRIAQVEKATTLAIEKAVRESNERLETTLKNVDEQASFLDSKDDIRDRKAKKRQKSNNDLSKAVAEAKRKGAVSIEEMAKQEAALAENLAFTEEILVEQNRTLDARIERLDLLSRGVEPNLARIQERAAKVRAENLRNEAALVDKVIKSERNLRALLQKRDERRAAGEGSQVDERAIREAIAQGRILRDALETIRRRILVDERDHGFQLAREKKKQLEKLVSAEEDALNEIARLNEEFNINSLEQVREVADARRAEAEKTAEFIKSTSTALVDSATPGIRAVRSALDDFTDALKGASQEDIEKLRDLFPKVIEERIKSATESMKEAQAELKAFQKVERPKQERDDRIARQRRFNELVSQGLDAGSARNEVERERIEQAKELDAKEKALKENVEEQKRIQRELLAEKKAVTSEFEKQAELSERTLTNQFDAQKRLNELTEERTQELQRQVEISRGERQAVQDKFGGGVAEATGIQTVPKVPQPSPTTPGGNGTTIGAGGGRNISELEAELNAAQQRAEEADANLAGIYTKVVEGLEKREKATTEITNKTVEFFRKLDAESKAGKRAFRGL